MEEKSIIISAPSGAGKTTIVQAILKRIPQLAFSISACSRAPRGKEIHGVDYYFLGKELFQQRIGEDSLIEWEEVYHGKYFGTYKSYLKIIMFNEKKEIL